jgi:RNA polymerase sigma-70 factor, ECF subfamily
MEPERNAPNRRPAESAGSPATERPSADAAERRLIESVLRRDRKAAADLVSAHADAVYAYVRHRLAPRIDRADDVVQDVFLAALGGLHTFSGTSSVRSWLLGIARHKVEDFYRRRLREPETIAEPGEPDEPVAEEPFKIEEQIDRARAAEKTHRILSTLPETYSIVLLWRYWENRSVREIAQTSGKTEKAIERLLARARTRFRELWDEVRHGE